MQLRPALPSCKQQHTLASAVVQQLFLHGCLAAAVGMCGEAEGKPYDECNMVAPAKLPCFTTQEVLSAQI
jgi:hypothetical protein